MASVTKQLQEGGHIEEMARRSASSEHAVSNPNPNPNPNPNSNPNPVPLTLTLTLFLTLTLTLTRSEHVVGWDEALHADLVRVFHWDEALHAATPAAVRFGWDEALRAAAAPPAAAPAAEDDWLGALFNRQSPAA